MKNGIKSFGNQAVDFPNERRKSTLNTGGKNPLERNLWCNYFKKKVLNIERSWDLKHQQNCWLLIGFKGRYKV